MPPTFAQLGVPTAICNALERRGITVPFDIQAATIADALSGRDVCGRAPTGSGKTLAFGIPLVATVSTGRPHRPRGLILAPTRELADQITAELRSISGSLRVGVVYGGVGYGAQIKQLRNGIDILVACPGRLEDLIAQGSVQLDDVDRVVIDEADRMADMGFLPPVRRLLDRTADRRQTVLFSATLDGDIATLTRRYQHDPVRHEVGESTPDITAAEHVFWKVAGPDRVELIADVVGDATPTIIFCRTRHGADRLARQLARLGVGTAALHGGRSQSQRTRALDDLHAGRVAALVATDVAARGIHVDGLETVIHFDPPADDKTYIHRSGRTARAGRGGRVISFVSPDGVREARRMQRAVGLDEEIGTAERYAALPATQRGDVRPPAVVRQHRAERSHPARPRRASAPARAKHTSRNRGRRKRARTAR
jgi:superfamily II DNA/RNA helicase